MGTSGHRHTGGPPGRCSVTASDGSLRVAFCVGCKVLEGFSMNSVHRRNLDAGEATIQATGVQGVQAVVTREGLRITRKFGGRLGPVYVQTSGADVFVSQSLPHLLAEVGADVDFSHVGQYIEMRLPLHATCWRGIYRLLPGSQLVVSGTGAVSAAEAPDHSLDRESCLAGAVSATNARGLLTDILFEHGCGADAEAFAFEFSGGLKSAALISVARDLTPHPRLVAVSAGFRDAVQQIEVARILGGDLVEHPPPWGNPGRAESWPLRSQMTSGSPTGTYQWPRLNSIAVAACADPPRHTSVLPILRYEQARGAGMTALVAGYDLGLTETTGRQDTRPANPKPSWRGRRWGRRMAAYGRNRTRRLRSSLMRPPQSDGARAEGPGMVLSDLTSQTPQGARPTQGMSPEQRRSWWAQHRLRFALREIEDQVVMARAHGLKLLGPLADPRVRALLTRPTTEPRTVLLEVVPPSLRRSMAAKLLPPTGFGKSELISFERAAARYRDLLASAPPELWAVVDQEAVVSRMLACQAAAGQGAAALAARDIVRRTPDRGELSQAEVVADWLRQWN